MTQERYLNSRETCKILGVNFDTLYRYIKPVGKNGRRGSRRHWRIKESDIEKFAKGEIKVLPAHKLGE